MKKILFFATLTLALVAGTFAFAADEATEEFEKLMKPAAGANGKAQKAIETDLAAAGAAAGEAKEAFAKIEAFWAKRGTADAQAFAKSAVEALGAVETAAKAGDKDAAAAAAKKVGATCQGCHAAHREKGADGAWMLK